MNPLQKALPNYYQTQQITEYLLNVARVKADPSLYNKIAVVNPELAENIDSITQYGDRNNPSAIADYEAIQNLMKVGKVFEVSKPITQLLLNTDTVIEPTRLPFNPMWIETNVSSNDIFTYVNPENKEIKVRRSDYLGFLIWEGSPVSQTTYKNNVDPEVKDKEELLTHGYPNIYIYAVCRNEGENLSAGYGHIVTNLYWKSPTDTGMDDGIIRHFIMNILNFLNEPDVKLVETLRTDRSPKKAEKYGKKPKVNVVTNTIKVTGQLKVYLERSCQHLMKRAEYSYMFWVRGHWRNFSPEVNKRWKTKKKTWIPPYIKGFGKLVDKNYMLDRKQP